MTTHEHGPVQGQVKSWNDEEGWGVLVSPEAPGEVWAHFSALRLPDPGAYRELPPGEPVAFIWEEADQDGYSYRAVEVRRVADVDDTTQWGSDDSGDHEPGTGSSSSLNIVWDAD
jgi:cold shock CspA family protein